MDTIIVILFLLKTKQTNYISSCEVDAIYNEASELDSGIQTLINTALKGELILSKTVI
jgi:hypothetical protein